jgi:hypothetical protein
MKLKPPKFPAPSETLALAIACYSGLQSQWEITDTVAVALAAATDLFSGDTIRREKGNPTLLCEKELHGTNINSNLKAT